MEIRLRNMAAIYIKHGAKYLLLYRIGSRVVPPSWCGIGGHFENDELNAPQTAMIRELEEEVGLTENDLKNINLRYVTFRLKNGEIRQNYYYFADLHTSVNINMECDEGKLEWIEGGNLPYEEMPHTAKYIMKHYMEIGKNNDSLYTGTATENDVILHELVEF